MASQSLNHRLVRNAYAENEAIARLFVERLLTRGHRHCVARVDVGDPRGNVQLVRRGEKPRSRGKRFAADRLRQPQGSVTEFFDSLRKFGRAWGRHEVDEIEDTEFSQIHDLYLPYRSGPRQSQTVKGGEPRDKKDRGIR
jgi:hypothetical protein